jgi:hypothetical protein
MSMLNRNFARRVSLLSRPFRGVLGMRGFSSVGFWRTIFFLRGGVTSGVAREGAAAHGVRVVFASMSCLQTD